MKIKMITVEDPMCGSHVNGVAAQLIRDAKQVQKLNNETVRFVTHFNNSKLWCGPRSTVEGSVARWQKAMKASYRRYEKTAEYKQQQAEWAKDLRLSKLPMTAG